MITSSPTWSPITQHFLCASQLTAAVSALTMTCFSRECCADSFAACIIRRSCHSFKPRATSYRNTAVIAHIRSLRRKLDKGIKPPIHTVASIGYEIDFNEPYSK